MKRIPFPFASKRPITFCSADFMKRKCRAWAPPVNGYEPNAVSAAVTPVSPIVELRIESAPVHLLHQHNPPSNNHHHALFGQPLALPILAGSSSHVSRARPSRSKTRSPSRSAPSACSRYAGIRPCAVGFESRPELIECCEVKLGKLLSPFDSNFDT